MLWPVPKWNENFDALFASLLAPTVLLWLISNVFFTICKFISGFTFSSVMHFIRNEGRGFRCLSLRRVWLIVTTVMSFSAGFSVNDDSDALPSISLSIVNALDVTEYDANDFDWEDRRPVALRQPFRRVGKSIYEHYYNPSVWTERFEQVRQLKKFTLHSCNATARACWSFSLDVHAASPGLLRAAAP